MSKGNQYDLESLDLPLLRGAALRVFAGLVENPLGKELLMGRLLRDGGIYKLRGLQLENGPTFLPYAGQSPAGEVPSRAPLPELEQLPAQAGPPAGFAFARVRDYARAYRDGRLTPEGVAERVLNAIQQSDAGDPPMRFFIACDAQEVRKQARESAQRLRAGRPLSLFDGVPVAIKDEMDMTPYPTTVGTRFLGRQPAREDATVVARLRQAGALLLGKTNMYEVGINPLSFNIHHGAVRNPYNVEHNAGGSSSGPAAVVAAGLCPVAIGADGGGSIRIPASFCGVVGLKATFGRVSEHGAFPLAWSVSHIGPLAATVEDAALAYAVIAGADPQDPYSQRQPAPQLDGWRERDLHGLTLGVYWPWARHATPAMAAGCERMLSELAKCGAAIREITLPELDAARVAHAVTILAEMVACLAPYFAEHLKDFAPSVRTNLAVGRALSAVDYLQAQRVRRRAMAHFQSALGEVDAILTPSTGLVAPPMHPAAIAGDESDLGQVTEIMRFIFPGNLTGLPAISFPAGYDEAGLPVGVQAIGRAWEEPTLLRIALAAEQLVERRQPAVYYDILNA